MNLFDLTEAKATKQRLDPKCWSGHHKEGTKVKGGVRVNNCVPNESIEEGIEIVYEKVVAEGGAETSWSNDTDTITLQDILELTKHIKQINLPINDNLKSKLLHWEGNPEEIERVNQVTVSNQFPILIMVNEQGQIEWILDGNHRLHKAIQSQAKTIPAKLIRPNNLNDKAKKIFNIKEQGVAEGHADQQRKIFKNNGKPVGEVGIDSEASPGNGNWYVKHYASGYDVVGFDSYEEAVAELKHCMEQGVAEDDQWHSGTSDQWHGQGSDAWHGATSDEWHGAGVQEADTAERLKRNLKKNGFDMDRFEAKIAEIERRNKELADEFYARHPELDDRVKDESATMFTSVGGEGGTFGGATLGTDNNLSPIGSGTVDEGYQDNEDLEELLQQYGEPVKSFMDAERRFSNGERIFAFHELDEQPTEVHDIAMLRNYTEDQLLALPQNLDEGREDEVGFGVSSEQAYNAVMAKFGDYIEHRDDGIMYAPRKLWSAIEQTAFDADGVGAEEDIAEDQYGGGFGGGASGPVTDSTSPVGGGGASVEEAKEEDITEDIYESRIYKMKLAGFFE